MQFTEVTGAVLDSVTFLVFGAVLLGPAFKHLSWQIALYGVLSLTIVRMCRWQSLCSAHTLDQQPSHSLVGSVRADSPRLCSP